LFFFQAEDGIRDRTVTGVQTCALPIFTKPAACPPVDATSYIRDVVTMTQSLVGSPKPIHPIGGVADCLKPLDVSTYVDATKASRSEERRVGKECRSRGSAGQ